MIASTSTAARTMAGRSSAAAAAAAAASAAALRGRGSALLLLRGGSAPPRPRAFSSTAGGSAAASAGGVGGGGGSKIPVRREVSKAERKKLRAARRERAALQTAAQTGGEGAAAATEAGGASAAAAAGAGASSSSSALGRDARLLYGAGVGIPVALLAWGIYDDDSLPARAASAVGLTSRIRGVTDEFARPVREKLLPDWSQMPNVPHDIPVPHTLVLDLENTLVSSTWDRKYGWRHAKRPGVDKFLHEMAQYYEIVLYSPSHEGVAAPVIDNLDKTGCIMHRLYREATYYMNGVHVKDLNSLNRNTNRMILIDDDPQAAQLNPENLIRVKPYTDPTDREDRTLARITPLLIEIAREGYNDVPAVLRQFRGMDADDIAEEHERRIAGVRDARERRARRGLGAFSAAGGANLPPPELSPEPERTTGAPAPPQQLSSKDIVGAAPEAEGGGGGGVIGWFNRRQKEQEEEQMRKMEKWNEHMMKKQKEREERARASA